MRTRLAALLVKDLKLHARGAVPTILVLVSLPAILFRTEPAPPGLEYLLLLTINLYVIHFWAEWFIAREKAKKTFAWLRSLPIGAGELYGSKIAAVSLCIVSLWTLSMVIAVGDRHGEPPWAMWIAVQAALLTYGAVTVFARWRFSQKLGQVLAPVLLALLGGVFSLLHFNGVLTIGDLIQMWGTRPGQFGVVAALVALYGGVGWMNYRWVAASETRALVE